MHLLKLMWYLVRCASWRDCFSAAKNVPHVQDSAGCRFDRGCDDSFVRIQKVRTVLGLIIALHSILDRSSVCSAPYRSCSWPSRGGPSALSLATFPWSGYSRRRRRPWGRRRPGAGAPGCRARRRRRSLPFRVKVKNTVQYCHKVRLASFSYTLSLLHKESMSTTCFVRVTVI